MDNFVVESATINDVCDIENLEKSYPYEVYSKAQINEMFGYDYYRILKCVKDNRLVGYLCATIVFDECNLLKIIVDKEFRQRGIGRHLIEKLIEVCQNSNVNNLYLEVRCDNNTAIDFYESVGFEFVDRRVGYYNGVDAKIYRLNF